MFKTKAPVAVEIFSAGVCNIDCAYCYIPKVDQMKDIHKTIIAKMESGEFINEMAATYGENLTNLGLWGTEPTITLPHVQKMLPELFIQFPKLESISWSSNFILPPTGTIEFIRAVIALDRPVTIRPQCSLDGPAGITDISRKGGAADTIVKNLLEFITIVQDMDLKKVTVGLISKPTWDVTTIAWLLEDKQHLKDYFDFWNPLIEASVKAKAKNKNFKSGIGSGFSIVVPGKYTVQDGKDFATLIEWVNELDSSGIYKHHGELNPYDGRLNKLFNYDRDLNRKPAMFTCSGGKSNFALDESGKMHICHRSFFLNNAEYVKGATNLSGIEKWGVSKFDRGSVNIVTKKFVVDPTNELELDRFLYVMGGYHHFTKLKLNYSLAMIQELVSAGQINSVYKDKELAFLFALFLNTAFSCPMENVLNTGIVHFQVVSLFRLLGNGAFEAILNHTLAKRKK